MWTKEAPTVPGFYWYRFQGKSEVVECCDWTSSLFDFYFTGNDEPHRKELMTGEFWSVPIQAPE